MAEDQVDENANRVIITKEEVEQLYEAYPERTGWRVPELLGAHFRVPIGWDGTNWFRFEMPESILMVTTVEVAFIHRRDEPLPADLTVALEQADEGNVVAGELNRESIPVDPDAARWWLHQVGNDGTFFDDDLEGGT